MFCHAVHVTTCIFTTSQALYGGVIQEGDGYSQDIAGQIGLMSRRDGLSADI